MIQTEPAKTISFVFCRLCLYIVYMKICRFDLNKKGLSVIAGGQSVFL